MTFDRFIGIDYSGAETPTSRLPGLQVFAATAADGCCRKWLGPTKLKNGGSANWTRKEIAQRLLDEAQADGRFLAGVDHCFSFPQSYFDRYGIATWPEFLLDFAEHWPTRGDHTYVDFVRDGDLHRRGECSSPGTRRGDTHEFRVCERWTSSAKCVFQFDVQGSVAKSSHAGIPWLLWLRERARDRLHFWPFDGWEPPSDKSVIVEVYPSIFRNRYERDGRTGDEQDAYATAKWMCDMVARDALSDYFRPPLSDAERSLAQREGWILGVR